MVLRMQIMLRKSCHRTLNNSKITAGGPCIPHPLGWGGRPQFDFLFILISSLHPRSHFISKCSYVAYSPFGAFCIHHINLYFGSIKPTRMLWRVMEFYLFQDLFCFLFAECLIE